LFFFSSRRRHTRWPRDWSSDVCSSDLRLVHGAQYTPIRKARCGRTLDEDDRASSSPCSTLMEDRAMLKRIFAATAVLALVALPLAAQAGKAAAPGQDVTIPGQVHDINRYTTVGA